MLTVETNDIDERPAPVDDEETHRTDVGNGDAFLRAYGDRVRYLHGRKQWLVWDGTRWVPDSTGAIERFAKATVALLHEQAESEEQTKWALSSESTGRLASMVKVARSDEVVSIEPADLDSDLWSLNVANGTVDLRTGELRPHRREELWSKAAKASYAPAAWSDRWAAFLLEVLPDAEVRRFVQKLVAIR